MDIRLYTKSGNSYYIDCSQYELEYMVSKITDSMDNGDMLNIESYDKYYVIDCRELEYFEVINNSYVEIKDEVKNKIGFKCEV